MPNESERRLILQHLPLVQAIARRVHVLTGERVECDELVSIGTLGLIQAARRYDASTGNCFSTYAYRRIQGAMYDALGELGPVPRGTWRRRRGQFHVRSLGAEPADRTGPSADEVADHRLVRGLVERALDRLPGRKRDLIRRCYYGNASLKDAGRELGVSKSWASRLHAQALSQLRQSLAELAPEPEAA